MSIYAIGDVQGCAEPLHRLLDALAFDPAQDQLWFCGDLVNRGPDSLRVLRTVKQLGDSAHVVLGNHDLHLIALALEVPSAKHRASDTLLPVLQAPDRDELIHWLRGLALLHHDASADWTLVHAGLAPQWTLADATQCANEVQAVLRSDEAQEFLDLCYRHQADRWHHDLTGMTRLVTTTAYLTRVRFCFADGTLEHKFKGAPGEQAAGLTPWFDLPQRAWAGTRVVFGHWAALGRYREQGLIGLDSGCVWGNTLSAANLNDDHEAWVGVACG